MAVKTALISVATVFMAVTAAKAIKATTSAYSMRS